MEDLIYLDINELSPNPIRARASFRQDTLVKLSESIRKHGILVPLLVASTPAGYQIISGERRWRAAKLAGLTQVPAIIKEIKPEEILIISLIENIQQDSLTVFEQGSSIQRLYSQFNIPLSEISEELGLSQDEIHKRLTLLQLSDKTKNEILTRKISDAEALSLVEKETEKEAYEEVIKKPKYNF